MEKKVYIRGNSEHPEKVMAALEKHECTNPCNVAPIHRDYLYFIDMDGELGYVAQSNMLYHMLLEYGEEIFPEPDYKFNIGDIVEYQDSKFTVRTQENIKGQAFYGITNYAGTATVAESDLKLCTDPEILTWDDMVKAKAEIKGYYLSNGGPTKANVPFFANECYIYRTEKQAKSAIAMVKISQLIEQPAYGGLVKIGEEAIIIDVEPLVYRVPCARASIRSKLHGGMLRFHTREQAELFLEHNGQLVKDYLMIE